MIRKGREFIGTDSRGVAPACDADGYGSASSRRAGREELALIRGISEMPQGRSGNRDAAGSTGVWPLLVRLAHAG